MRLAFEQAAIFSGAFLLFQVQPLMGRFLLPWFGGSPSVWTACMLFFQTLLLAGYGWAHAVASRRIPLWIHRLLFAASIGFLLHARPALPGTASPTLAVLEVLAVTAGIPYFLLASLSPLIQKFSAAPDPYRLYALSNAGSLAGLLSYPFLIEPLLPLGTQWNLWRAAYAVLAAVVAIAAPQAARFAPAVSTPGAGEPNPGRDPRRVAHWLTASALGSVLLLATTGQMTQEITISPFLWVIPLAIYLLTFTLAFGSRRVYRPPLFAGAAAVIVPAACILKAIGLRAPLSAHLLVNTAMLLVCAMICHGELARSRPPRQALTHFYLWISIGGAIGGLLVAVGAPRLFTGFAEYEAAMAGACLLAFPGASRALKQLLVLAALIAVAATTTGGSGETLAKTRNFFGTLRVSGQDGKRVLSHGRVTHGFQFLDPEKRRWPTAYYGPGSGLGLAMELRHPLRAGIIGLGTGTAAAYGQPGDLIRFYEINPDVEEISRRFFTFRADSKATVEVVLGDARLQLDREPPSRFDVLAIDAFSSDAVPAHLLTSEALAIYRRHLAPDGILLFHVTNQYLDLAPLVRGLARSIGWQAARIESKPEESRGVSAAVWVIVTANEAFLDSPRVRQAVSPWPQASHPLKPWTDDRINVLAVLR